MFTVFILLLLVIFIAYRVHEAISAWRLTKGIKEFKERGFKGAIPPFSPTPLEFKAGLALSFIIITAIATKMLDDHIIPYFIGGLLVAPFIPIFFRSDIPEETPDVPGGWLVNYIDPMKCEWWIKENPVALWDYGYKQYGRIMVASIVNVVIYVTLIVLVVLSHNV